MENHTGRLVQCREESPNAQTLQHRTSLAHRPATTARAAGHAPAERLGPRRTDRSGRHRRYGTGHYRQKKCQCVPAMELFSSSMSCGEMISPARLAKTAIS